MALPTSGMLAAKAIQTEAKQTGLWDINHPVERKIAKKPVVNTPIQFGDFYGKSRGRCLYYPGNWFMTPWGNGGGSGWQGNNPIDGVSNGGWPFAAWNKDKYLQYSGSSGGPAYYPVIGYGGPIYYTFGCDNIGTLQYATTTDNNADPSKLTYTQIVTCGFVGVNNWTHLGDFADDLNIWFKVTFADQGRVFVVTLGVSSTPNISGLMTSTINLTSNGQPYYCTPDYAIDFTETVWVQPAQAVADTTTADATVWVNSCFLKGSPVAMADGTFKPIEDIQVGDYLLGAHGAVNPVLALNRPLLGDRMMSNINGEHMTTLDHAHLRPDNTFGAVSLYEYVHGENNTVQTVITAEGDVEQWLLPGFAEADMDLITQIELGDQLVTVDGSRTVTSLEQVKLPADTQLYNFVMGGDHTYFVSDYCVTGFLNGIDFDYRNWKPVGQSWTRDQYRRG